MGPEFLLFACVGFLAQMIDGALGMGYGIVSSSALMAFGVPPATASASIHAAKLCTTATSGACHALHRNVDWRLFARLVPAGIAGGVVGAYIVTSISGAAIRPFIAVYLAVMGSVVLWRVAKGVAPRLAPTTRLVAPVGVAGGFCDAVGGGGWGPVVTSCLMGAGGQPRYVIGTVNAAEFLVTLAIVSAFVTALLTGHWDEAGTLLQHAAAVAGLIVGGLLAAPVAGFATRIAPPRVLGGGVGALILSIAGYQAWSVMG
jgi:uncharacterized protein